MKVLIVSSHLTHPTDAGNRAAIMAQVNILKSLGHDVHLLFIDMSLRNTDYSEMQQYWGDRYHVFHQPTLCKAYRLCIDFYRKHTGGYWKWDDHYAGFGLAAYVNRLQEEQHFDAVIVQYMRLAKLLPQITIPRKAIYTHDVFAYKDLRTGGPFYETCTAHQEAKAMQCCPTIFAIQESEAAYYSILSPKSVVRTVYCPYDFHEQPIVPDCQNLLYMASSMEFNVNGIQWFIDNVWPSVSATNPKARLLIAGAVSTKINTHGATGIETQGFVREVANFYQRANIVINPVYQGTGLKIKTFEALSYGKTTIVHPHSTTGIYERSSAPLIVAQDATEWIQKLNDALRTDFPHEQKREEDRRYILSMKQHIEQQFEAFLHS